MKVLSFITAAILFAGISVRAAAQDTSASEKEVPVDLDSLEEAKEQPVDLDSLEEAVDLDSLDEESGSGKTGDANEPLLPITVTNVEVEQNGLLILVVLTVLVPVGAMLFPPKRKRRKKKGTAAGTKSKEKKET